MNKTGQVTQEDMLRVAELAHLELTAEEQSGMLRDLNSVLGYVAQLNELDTANVPAMAQVGELMGNVAVGHGESLRPDVPAGSLDRNEVLASAPESDGVYFKVPKVIER